MRKATRWFLLVCACAVTPLEAQISMEELKDFNWAWPEVEEDYWHRPRRLGNESLQLELEEQQVRAQVEERRLGYTGIDWVPAQVSPPPGGGAPALFAGTNYTRWRLQTTDPVTNTGRLIVVIPEMRASAAIAGHCLVKEYGFSDVLPPLDANGTFTAHEWSSPPKDPIKFSQGGIYKLCWTEQGNFGIGDGWIVPFYTTSFRIFGALDSCKFPWCLASRRFFCTQINSLYAWYLPTGTRCDIFIEASYGPLLYSRLTWQVGTTCQTPVGDNLIDGMNYIAGPDYPWVKIVDPLSLVQLGETRRDQQKGFNYRLCFCPGFDNQVDGVCGAYDDFVQQVGHLSGLMASYLNIGQAATIQIITMTRFSIKVDCGDGPHCATDGLERVKLIPREWNPNVGTSEDGVFWNTSTTCDDKFEVSAWYGPPNCVNGSGGGVMGYIGDQKKSAGGDCRLSGGTDPSVKIFGKDEVRILPKLEGTGRPVAQIFQLCFLHKPSDLDGVAAAQWDPFAKAAIMEDTRTFWKLAELVVEPLLLYGGGEYVMTKTVSVRAGPPDLIRSNNLHGHPTSGPILKLVEEDRRSGLYIDERMCNAMTPRDRDISGLSCTSPADCQPRADKIGNELVINDVVVKRSGIFVVCYCEKWYNEADACQKPAHWTVVGKVQVSGPSGNQEWILDTNMIQSLYVQGYGFKDENVVRILEEGQYCNDAGYEHPESTLCIFRGGNCIYHGTITNATHMADIQGTLRKWNSVNPPAVIQSITPWSEPYSLVNFAEVPVLQIEDIIKLEDNIYSGSPHWVRQRDLNRLVRGGDDGHEVVNLLNAGKSAMIRFHMDPYPPIMQNPPQYGKWWRTTQSKLLWLRGRKEKSQLPVCWGPKAGEYLAWAGYINVINPVYMPRLVMGLTSTAAGSTAPVMLSFWTGKNPLFREPRNPTQLRITWMNSSILALAEAGAAAGPLGPILRADQMHEASQAVCGQLIVEMWSTHEFGFPVPRGCYWDYNRYDSGGRMRSVFILFEALNGLKAQERYTLVFNMQLLQEMSFADYAALEDPLIEVAALDDIVIKPEGVIEIGWVNPDKQIVRPASSSVMSPRFFNVTQNETVVGPSFMNLLERYGENTPGSKPPLLHMDNIYQWKTVVDDKVRPDEFGFTFLLRGDEAAPITKSSIIRIFLWPLTAWSLDHRSKCKGECFAQEETSCGAASATTGGWVGCDYAATQSECANLVPEGKDVWVDNRGRGCEWYVEDKKCKLDGNSYTPESGISAVQACCTCGGGERQNANVLKLTLPTEMDAAFGSQVIHTIKVKNVAPLTKQGFFATRWGSQLSNMDDDFPQYAMTTGAYMMKAPSNGSYATVASLFEMKTWGNSKPFSADKDLNDFYMRLQMPITLFGTAGFGNPSGAAITITLPEGYQCKFVHAASPRGGGDDTVPLPILPEDPPNGNSALPDSTSGEGNSLGFNSSALIVGIPSGQWEFKDNLCIFHFAPYMVLFQHQRVYMYIFAYNPLHPMPYEDPRNFWTVNFTSRGDASKPDNYPTTPPCSGQPYNPPYCNDTGESYYINNRGSPQVSRSKELLHPDADRLKTMAGPYGVQDDDGDEMNRTWTDRFVVLGRLKEIIAQPREFHLGALTYMMIWFIPDLGSNRGGILSVEFPTGYVVPSPCDAHDLPHSYYSMYSPPYIKPYSNSSLAHALSPRIWPLDGILGCGHLLPGQDNTAAISVKGSMVTARRYGFEVGVTNPVSYNPAAHADHNFMFKLFIRDAKGRPRDGTYTTAVFDPYTTAPKVEFGESLHLYALGVRLPVVVHVEEMRPYAWTKTATTISILNITFNMNVRGRLRITAPPGYQWAWNSPALFTYSGLPGQTRDMPGGVPPYTSPLSPNVFEWNDADLYEAFETYSFRTLVTVPSVPARASANKFFFEWGFNETAVSLHTNASLFGRAAAARAPAQSIRSLRGFKVEASTTVAGETGKYWFWFETITPILANGSMDLLLPFHDMQFENMKKWTFDGPDYCKVLYVKEFLSDPLPSDLMCRRVLFPNAMDAAFNAYMEVRLELSAPQSGIIPGRYVVEFQVTNPPLMNTVAVARNAIADDNPCGRQFCWTLYSEVKRYEIFADTNDQWRTMQSPFPNDFTKQNDYWTSIPALRITRRMKACEIVDMPSPDWLDIRLAIGRNDRPAQRSAIVIAFMLDSYASAPEDTLDIRAPFGFLFDSICEFYVNDEVFPIGPGSTGMPKTYQPKNFTSPVPVAAWPRFASAKVTKCRGEGHNARVWFGRGLVPKQLYMFRITLQMNPILTPVKNTWMVAYGGESSGHMDGYEVWTFPGSYLDPVSRSWTIKPAPQQSPVILNYRPTNTISPWAPPLLFGQTILQPLLRVIAPALYEFLVDAEDQDIQGGDCFAIIQEVGDCRTCGAPFAKETLSCRREWNRKNVALIQLLGDTTLMAGQWYSVALTLFNPHIMDSFESTLKPWIFESFLGTPWPLVQPNGYEIDLINTTGYKIAEKATLEVEKSFERNGSAYVSMKQFSMQFTDELKLGDQILLRAPLGFDSTRIIRGLIDTIVCLGFEYNLPAIYPPGLDEETGNYTTMLPPWRPRIPDPDPLWANNSAIIEDSDIANVSNTTDTMWEVYNYTVLRQYCLEDRWRDTNVTENTTNVISDGFDWVRPPLGVMLNLTVNRGINKTLYPNMLETCLHATWTVMPEIETGPDGCDPCCLVWKPDTYDNCCNFTNSSSNDSNASNSTPSSNQAFACSAPARFHKQLCSLTTEDEVPPGAELMSFRVLPNPHAGVVPEITAGRGARKDSRGRLPLGAFDAELVGNDPPPWASRWAPLRRAAAINESAESGTDMVPNATTTWASNYYVPRNRTCINGSYEDGSNCTVNTTATRTTTTMTTTIYTGPWPCMGGILVEIFWATNVNLTEAMQDHTQKRQAALTLEQWDRFPIRTVPSCSGREWVWNISKEDIHPEGSKMLNGTKIFFKLSYQNSRRPPLYHENFWQVYHYAVTTKRGPFAGELQVSSSAAVESWTIISRLRYIRIEVLKEVLRPLDTTELHIEFVTVNLASTVMINTSFPEGFDFSAAYVTTVITTTTTMPEAQIGGRLLLDENGDPYDGQEEEHRRFGRPWMSTDEDRGQAEHPLQFDRESPLDLDFDASEAEAKTSLEGLLPSGQALSLAKNNTRRLQDVAFTTPYTWKGYTPNVQILEAKGNMIRLSCDLARVEYVRFRIAGVRIPWKGGQSIFNVFTMMREDDADSMQNCCPPGYPPNNPGYTFMVPYRMDPIIPSIKNEFQQEPALYPIMGQWETRFNENCLATFLFKIPHPHQPRVDNGLIVLVVRAPPGYHIYDTWYQISDAGGCQKEDGQDVCGLRTRETSLVKSARSGGRRIELAFHDQAVMHRNFDYQVELSVRTPLSIHDRHSGDLASSLWVMELNDVFSLGEGRVSGTLGSYHDFILNNSVNITLVAPDSPPDVVIPVTITFNDVGEIDPTQVQVYAPLGYKFMPNCLAPGQDLEDHIVSCRERWSLFGATYLTGAVMMTINAGLSKGALPVSITLVAKTPDITPADNKWWSRVSIRTGPTAWGWQPNPFPVRSMNAGVSLIAIARSRVTLFLRVFFRYPLPWGGHVHVAAPKTYKLFCPIIKVLSGLDGKAPMCTEEDPLLAGCWGLPAVDDQSITPEPVALPNCDPRHEILLTFPLPSTTTTTTGEPITTLPPWQQWVNEAEEEERAKNAAVYAGGTTATTTTTTTSGLPLHALPAGSSFLLAFEIEVPMRTPTPRSENIWRIRVLDASKTSLDGKLNIYGAEIRQVPVVEHFRIWWTTSLPGAVTTIVLEFYFNNSRGELWRADEIVRVIDVVAPEGLTMAIRRPSDVKPLSDEGVSIPVANWSWSPIMPRHVWFTLDPSPEKQNFTGMFHFAFPVLTPTIEVGMPLNNLWQIKLCGDQPYCTQLVLNIPIPGFFFGEDAPYQLDKSVIDRLTGSHGIRAAPTWYCSGGLLIWLAWLRWNL